MKKCILALVIAILFVTLIPCASCADQPLRQVQNYIGNNAMFNVMSPSIALSGEVADIYYTGVRNDWEMKIKVDEEMALVPLGSDYAYFIAHFCLHLDECPFKVGETIAVKGSINTMYSSIMVPVIIVSTINGGTDF